MGRTISEKTYRLALIGVLSAIIIIQNFIPFLGYIPFPLFNLTIIQVTIIIGAVSLGAWAGGVLGFIWGVLCMIRAAVWPTLPTDPIFFINPLVSVLPRILVGLSAGALFSFLKRFKMRRVPNSAICGVVGSLVNTVMVLGMIFLLYRNDFAREMSLAAGAVLPALLSVVATNGVGEAVVSGILTPLIAVPLSKFNPELK